MQVFESLNCVCCKKPFDRAPNQPHSPLRWPFGRTICRDCNGKGIQPAPQQHIAYYLFDLLSQEDALILAPGNRGYFLAKPIKIPECPVCHDKYSNTVVGKKLTSLQCGHALYAQCYRMMPVTKSRFRLDEITCPLCNFNCATLQCSEKNRFNDFLHECEMVRQWEEIFGGSTYGGSAHGKTSYGRTTNGGLTFGASICGRTNGNPGSAPKPEQSRLNDYMDVDELPEMRRQMEEALSCDDCHEMYHIEKMFHCHKCSSKACGCCAYMKHQGHQAISFLEKEVGEVSGELRSVCKTYKDIFPYLHKELLEDIDAFETICFWQAETLKDASLKAVLEKKRETFTKWKTDFEEWAEEYLPHLRKIITNIKESRRVAFELR